MNEVLSWGSLVVAVVAVAIAVWQGRLSKSQLKLAQDTTATTERSLSEIRDLARDNEKTVRDIKSSIDERITRILDTRLDAEQQELRAKAQKDEESSAMAKSMMSGLGKMFMDSMKEGQRKASETSPELDDPDGGAKSG